MATLTVRAKRKAWKASKDDGIVTMPVSDVMRKHGLRHQAALMAIRIACKRLDEDGRLELLKQRKRIEKRYANLGGAAFRHPGILSRIRSEGNNSIIARDFGISREWVRRLRRDMHELVVDMGCTETVLIEKLAG